MPHPNIVLLLVFLLKPLTINTLFLKPLPVIEVVDNSTYPILILPPHNHTTYPNPHLLADHPPPQCHRITNPPVTGLNPTHCDHITPQICDQLTRPLTPPSRLRRNHWFWSELPGCALAYYIPDEADVRLPNWYECAAGIFGGITELCARDSRWNAGGVNVGVWPDFGGDGTAVREGEVRFLMAPERLTL